MKTSINQSILRGALVAVGLFAGTAHAGYITGVTATTSMGVYQGLNYGIAHITDGSGLEALSFLAGHSPGSATVTWIGRGTAGTIDFDLHGIYKLDTLAVWNTNGSTARGVKDLTVYTSSNGVDYALMAGAPTQFAKAVGLGGNPALKAYAQVFSLAPTADTAYVRFVINDNWGSTDGTAGLAEIGFGGTPVTTTVPEPATWALVGLGAVAAWSRRRRR